MPELRNDLLRFEYLTTNAAMTALRLAIFRTRCRYGGICYNSMAACLVKYDAANGTSLRRYASRRRTGRMTFRRNTLRAFFVAAGTRRSLYAFFRAGGRRRLHILTPNMAERGHRLLRLEHRSAAGAVTALRLACRRTRCSNRRIRHRAVTQRRKRPRRRGTAARASCRLRARRRACRRFGRRIAAIVMAQRRRLIAGIAVTAAAAIMVCIAARGTRRTVGRRPHTVPQCRRRTRRSVPAAGAGAAPRSARSTRRRRNRRPAVTVAQCGYRCAA